MVSQVDLEERTNRIFRALADATRRDIVRRTLTAEASISELAGDYDMSFAAVQKHVRVLEAADLVARIPKGRERMIRGNPETIRRAQEALAHFERIWRDRIGRLDDLFAADADPDPAPGTDPDPATGPGAPLRPHPA